MYKLPKFIFGIEWEFYITKNCQQISFLEIEELGIIKKIEQYLLRDFKGFFQLKKEKGQGQFEIVTKTISDKDLLYHNFNKLKENLPLLIFNFDLEINYLPQPFVSDCGNALQINLTIWDNGCNIFCKFNNEESKFLLFAIGGILARHQKEVVVIAATNNNYDRYDLALNQHIFKLGKYPSPTRVNWGYNNRSCLLRVVGKDNNRRLEYRGGNADCNLKKLLEKIINSVEFGLNNNIKPIEPCYGNSFDQQYHNLYQNIK